MIQNLVFVVYLLISDSLVESIKANKNWEKRSLILQYSFAQKASLILRTLTPSKHYKKYTPTTQPKTLLTYKFSKKHVFGWCQKKHLHCTISRRPRIAFSKHLESKCLVNLVNLRQKIFVPET